MGVTIHQFADVIRHVVGAMGTRLTGVPVIVARVIAGALPLSKTLCEALLLAKLKRHFFAAKPDTELDSILPIFLLSGFLMLDASGAFPWVWHSVSPLQRWPS
jgi:hypothetical protein